MEKLLIKLNSMKWIALFTLSGLLFSFTFSSYYSHSNSHSVSHSPSASSGGIKFVKLTFEKALKQAKSSGKLIFIDMHTSWCGPCKEMAATTFRDPEVGKLFNERFINLKIDAEEDQDGPGVAKRYGITAYPTLLFVDGTGKLVKKVVGKQSKDRFLSIAKSL